MSGSKNTAKNSAPPLYQAANDGINPILRNTALGILSQNGDQPLHILRHRHLPLHIFAALRVLQAEA
jgi:hypothetical protein